MSCRTSAPWSGLVRPKLFDRFGGNRDRKPLSSAWAASACAQGVAPCTGVASAPSASTASMRISTLITASLSVQASPALVPAAPRDAPRPAADARAPWPPLRSGEPGPGLRYPPARRCTRIPGNGRPRYGRGCWIVAPARRGPLAAVAHQLRRFPDEHIELARRRLAGAAVQRQSHQLGVPGAVQVLAAARAAPRQRDGDARAGRVVAARRVQRLVQVTACAPGGVAELVEV